MGRWKAPAVGICICFLVVVALLTILFVVMNKHPETRTDLSSTDMRLIHEVSSVWCGSQEITSLHPFTAYRITGEPVRDRSPSRSHHFNYSMKLRWGKERQLKYYLLPGASVHIQACSDRPGVILRIFQSIRKWRECRRLRNKPFYHDDDSSSSEESGEDGSRLKGLLKRNLRRHPWHPPDCKEAMRSYDVPSGKDECKRSSFLLTVNSESTYVFSYEDYHNAADESSTEVQMVLNRTRYHTGNAMVVCYDVTACEVPLSFGSDERAIVVVGEEVNAGAVTYGVVAKCKPRVFFFILLFAFIPLLLLLCIGCVIFCFHKKSGVKTTVKYIKVCNKEQSVAPNRPLLSGPQVTIYSRTEGLSRPPAYPESTAPPPYAQFQAATLETYKKGGNGQ